MPVFHEILTSTPEQVVDLFYAAGVDMADASEQGAAEKLQLNTGQLVCALGFNPEIQNLLDIVFTLGYESQEDFLRQRNRIFITDVYQQLTLKQVFAIYESLLNNSTESIKFITTLLMKRIGMIEQKIESTVKPMLIENYRQEMKTIYRSGALPIDFVEIRLENTHSGFRALIDEIGLIVDAQLISAMEIFIRDSVLPQEKRRLINRGLIPKELIEKRLKFQGLSDQEREMLEKSLYE